MNNEVSIEEYDKNLRQTTKMASDNEQKLDELSRKLGVQEDELKRAIERAELAENKLKGIEEELQMVGENMKQLEKSAEKAVEREEKLKDKILQIQQKYKAALYFCWIWRILSFSFSSLSTAFSADFSNCFMFSPTICSSSSIPLSLFSANSALSIALFSSSSWTPSFLLSSSSFCSLSEAILVVCLRFLSYSSMLTSLFMHLDSNTFTFFRIPSASLEDRASLVTVMARVSSDFLDSSSISIILLVRAEISPSTSLNILSFSSKVSVAF